MDMGMDFLWRKGIRYGIEVYCGMQWWDIDGQRRIDIMEYRKAI
jgi:hypothetical protein